MFPNCDKLKKRLMFYEFVRGIYRNCRAPGWRNVIAKSKIKFQCIDIIYHLLSTAKFNFRAAFAALEMFQQDSRTTNFVNILIEC